VTWCRERKRAGPFAVCKVTTDEGVGSLDAVHELLRDGTNR
jgi:hypothetical protein